MEVGLLMKVASIVDKLRNGESLENDELQKAIELMTQNKKYGLVWEDHPESVDLELKDGVFNIKEVKERRIYEEEHGRENLLLEGDNLHSLMMMKDAGVKTDVIYIDPPYNTGSEFIYDDSRVGREDDYRHSKWLSFMEKRLKIARDLLTDDGVIFVSIDDNELGQLKLILDNLFGESCYHGNISWIKRTKPINSGRARYKLQQNIEYILVYSKIPEYDFKGFDLNVSGERKYNQVGKFGNCRYVDLEDSDHGRKGRETMKFPILGVKPGVGRRWKIGLETASELIDRSRIILVDGKPKRVIYPNDEQGDILKPFWSHISDTGSAETGKRLLSDILGPSHNFDTVKPIDLIKHLISHIPYNSSLTILDFFAGSGTTGHAVMELNEDDGGNRRFILCTNNENNIAEDVTYERLRRVITGDWVSGQREGLSNNLSYYQVDIDNKDDIEYDEKLKRSANNELLRRIIKDELMIEKQTDDYVILSDYNGGSVLFILSNIITDDIRSLDLDCYDRVYTHYVTSRDVLFENLSRKNIEFY